MKATINYDVIVILNDDAYVELTLNYKNHLLTFNPFWSQSF